MCVGDFNIDEVVFHADLVSWFNLSIMVFELYYIILTLSAPQEVTKVIKTKVKVKGLGRISSYLAGIFILFMVL